ncbi:hypothetical protein L9F63_021307, partial [Diploptera punctata]
GSSEIAIVSFWQVLPSRILLLMNNSVQTSHETGNCADPSNSSSSIFDSELVVRFAVSKLHMMTHGQLSHKVNEISPIILYISISFHAVPTYITWHKIRDNSWCVHILHYILILQTSSVKSFAVFLMLHIGFLLLTKSIKYDDFSILVGIRYNGSLRKLIGNDLANHFIKSVVDICAFIFLHLTQIFTLISVLNDFNTALNAMSSTLQLNQFLR